jgi:hypothetical protein
VRNAPSLSSLAPIAHLSDLHMLGTRPARARSVLELGMRFASFGRALNPKQRIDKLVHHEVDLSLDRRLPRIFGAPAVVDDRRRAPRVRLYEVAGSSLRSLTAPKQGSARALAA